MIENTFLKIFLKYTSRHSALKWFDASQPISIVWWFQNLVKNAWVYNLFRINKKMNRFRLSYLWIAFIVGTNNNFLVTANGMKIVQKNKRRESFAQQSLKVKPRNKTVFHAWFEHPNTANFTISQNRTNMTYLWFIQSFNQILCHLQKGIHLN